MIFAWSGGVWHVAGPGGVVGRQRVRDGRDRVRQEPINAAMYDLFLLEDFLIFSRIFLHANLLLNNLCKL